ncbi:MAG TPA: hypothetical protein VK171_06270, partial [Fimbriimonas sp.]|nr:hypothetical protein [Fimbriimonas sp.]
MRLAGLFGLGMVALAANSSAQAVGYLGQCLEAATIYASPNSKSRVYFKAKQYQYLIVNKHNDNYVKVVMSNGANGYAPTSKVVMFPHKVTRKASTSRAAAAKQG